MTELNFIECKTPTSPDRVLDKGFADYMVKLVYANGKWIDGYIMPYESCPSYPQSTGERFGLTLCESVRISLDKDKKAVIFRPDAHIERLIGSAKRMSLPICEADLVLYALKELVKLQRMFVTDKKHLFASIMLKSTDTGAVPFPVNNAELTIVLEYREKRDCMSLSVKSSITGIPFGCEPNSATFFSAAALSKLAAKREGYDSVMWLDPIYNRYAVGLAGMNLIFRIGDEVIIPEDGIFGGVTKESLVTLIKDWGIPIQRRGITTDELIKSYKSGELTEVFATSVKEGVLPVVKIAHGEDTLELSPGKLAKKLHDSLISIENGVIPQYSGWTVRL